MSCLGHHEFRCAIDRVDGDQLYPRADRTRRRSGLCRDCRATTAWSWPANGPAICIFTSYWSVQNHGTWMAGGLRPQIAAAARRACSSALWTDFSRSRRPVQLRDAGWCSRRSHRSRLSSVRHCASTTMPSSTVSPASRASSTLGTRARADDDDVGVVVGIVANDTLDRPVALQAAHHRAGADGNSFLAVQPGHRTARRWARRRGPSGAAPAPAR